MLCDIPSSQAWLTHLKERFAEATDLGLLNLKAAPSWQAAKLFVPANLDCSGIGAIDPQTPLRALRAGRSVEGAGWVAREDLFADAAHWLSTTLAENRDAWLVCEAGYSEVGDKVLQQRPHIVHAGRPLLHIKIAGASVEDIATVLRWGRSWRFLGVAQSGNAIADSVHPSTQGLFICDAFDGDSLVVADLGLWG